MRGAERIAQSTAFDDGHGAEQQAPAMGTAAGMADFSAVEDNGIAPASGAGRRRRLLGGLGARVMGLPLAGGGYSRLGRRLLAQDVEVSEVAARITEGPALPCFLAQFSMDDSPMMDYENMM
jgi:hypothetical protein